MQYILLTALEDLAFLFVKKQPLSWSQTLFGYYHGLKRMLQSLGLFVVLPLLKKAGLADAVILMIGILSSTAGQIIFGFSTTTWMVFLSMNFYRHLHIHVY